MKLALTAAACTAVFGGTTTAQSFTTVFGPGGAAGLIEPDVSLLNGIESFTTFGENANGTGAFANSANAGETLFFQIGPMYVGGAGPSVSNPLSPQALANLWAPIANDRAYGVIGEGRSDIVFEAGSVDTLVLQARGSTEGMTTGTNPATNFGGTPVEMADAAGSVLIWTELGLELELSVSNSDFETFSVDASNLLGDSITRLSIINNGPANSAVALGELTATLVPAPASAALLGAGGLVAARRRR